MKIGTSRRTNRKRQGPPTDQACGVPRNPPSLHLATTSIVYQQPHLFFTFTPLRLLRDTPQNSLLQLTSAFSAAHSFVHNESPRCVPNYRAPLARQPIAAIHFLSSRTDPSLEETHWLTSLIWIGPGPQGLRGMPGGIFPSQQTANRTGPMNTGRLQNGKMGTIAVAEHDSLFGNLTKSVCSRKRI